MNTTKILSFIGMERCDIVVYMALTMAGHKFRVLVIDNSLNHDLFKSLKKPEEDMEYVESGRIVYMKNVAYSEGAFEKFDLVLVYHGFNVDEELLMQSNKVIFISDYFQKTIETIHEYINIDWINENIPKNKLLLVYRDKLSGKISEIYLQQEIGLKNFGEEWICHFDESDYILYQMLTYNGPQEVKTLSSDIRALIGMLKDDVLGKKRKKKTIEEEEEEE